MNSSKGWGDNPEQVQAGGDPEFSRRILRVLLVVLAALAVGAGAFAVRPILRARSEPLLAEARLLVQSAAKHPEGSVERLRNAESLLREYLNRDGANEDSARLLLCATLTLRVIYDRDQRIGDATEIEQLLNTILPAACPLQDLLTAIDIFIHSGRLAQADWLVGAALRKSEGTPDEARILRLAIALRYDLGHEHEVLEHCARLAEIDPGDPEPWRRMAMVYEDGGYDERMIEAIHRVIELDEAHSAEDRLKLINALITVGDRKQAREHFDVLHTQSPDLVARHRLTEARLLMLEGQTGNATAIIERILADDPEATEAMLLNSQLLLSQNRRQDAAVSLERLLELDPMNFQAHYVMGQVAARQGERARAERHLTLHQKILDTRVRIHTLERRAGRNPHDSEARTELIELYQMLGMTEHAEFWRRAASSLGD